jgi:hypothetical protein
LQAQIFVNNYFCIGALEILCLKIQFQSEFGQVHYEEWFKRIHTKFTLKFLSIFTSFYKFLEVCPIFWNYLTKIEKGKRFNSARAEIRPAAIVLRPTACHVWLDETAARPRPGGLAQRGKRPAWPAATHARRVRAGVVTTRRPHVG